MPGSIPYTSLFLLHSLGNRFGAAYKWWERGKATVSAVSVNSLSRPASEREVWSTPVSGAYTRRGRVTIRVLLRAK